MRRPVCKKKPSLTHLLPPSANATSPSARSSEVFLVQFHVEENQLYHYNCYIGMLIDLEVEQFNCIFPKKIDDGIAYSRKLSKNWVARYRVSGNSEIPRPVPRSCDVLDLTCPGKSVSWQILGLSSKSAV
jgi:hypothetical protein